MLSRTDVKRISAELCNMLLPRIEEIMQEKSPDRIMDVNEAAEFLSVKPSYLRHHMADYPHHQEAPHKKVTFVQSELIKYIRAL